MKQRFTKLLAAVTLLVGLTIPMGMWGQTTVTWPGTSALPGTATAVANDQNVTIKTSSTNTYANPIRIYANTTVTINALNGAKILSVAYEASSTGNYVTYAQNATVSPNVTPTVSGKIVTWTYTESANVTEFTFTPSSQTRSNGITITYKTSGGTPSTPTCTIDPTTWEFGDVAIGMNATKEFTVTTANLTGVLSLAMTEGVYSVVPTTIAQNATTTTVTVTFTPTEEEEVVDELSITGGGLESATTAIVSGTGYQAQVYTITFNAGSGTCTTGTMTGVSGSEITLPTATPSQACQDAGWTFAGWATTIVSGTTTAPTLLNGEYTITGNAPLYAVYKVTESDGDEIIFDFPAIANANEWENGVAYTEVIIDPVTITAQGGGNNGKWYTSGSGSWRMYSGGTVEISADNNAVINVVSTPTCEFTISNGIATFSPSARTDFTTITVTYGSLTTTYNSNPSCMEKVATPTFTPAAGTFNAVQSVTIECETVGAAIYYTVDGTEPTNESTLYSSPITVNETMTIKAIAVKSDMNDSEIATAEYIIFIPSTYSLATTIESGKHYIIIANDKGKAAGTQNGDYRSAVDIVLNDNVATSNIDVYEFVINGPDADGFYTIYDPVMKGFLYPGDKKLKYQLEPSLWDIEFGNESVTIKPAEGNYTDHSIQYNATSPRFACYSSNQTAVSLYVKENETNYEFYKYIAKYTETTPSWYFIASPVGNIAPTNVTNLTTTSGNGYDLYRFNQAADAEWENYKQEGDHYHFGLESGRGYLYANSANTTLVFRGTPYSDNGEVTLHKTDNAEYSGWNLVGNPFASNAKVSKAFYKMNSTSDGINATPLDAQSVIASMEGVFVLASEEGEKVTFTATTEPVTNLSSRSMSIDVNRNGEMLDRAIVSFNAEGSLSKLVLSDNTTKLYFRQGQKDYAIVASDNENEMPVSFKASRNGTYTLNINTENVEMNYLHLIDNMTGMDVDLLQTPSYTFDATTNDYASRFRLVFSANNVDGPSTGSEAFAFYSNGNWVVGNEGEATLQVIDVNGRIVSNETINGTVATSINATPGVYMLRLVNGNEVKTQKIVVK